MLGRAHPGRQRLHRVDRIAGGVIAPEVGSLLVARAQGPDLFEAQT